LKPFTADSFVYRSYSEPRPKRQPSRFTLESFGKTEQRSNGFEELECPVCTPIPPNRTRYTIDPFGAKATLSFWHNRLQFSASFGGTESWRPDGLLQGIGNQKLSGSPLSNALGGITAAKLRAPDHSFQWGGQHLITSDQYNDQWLLQSHLTARVFLDSEKNISMGVTKGYFYNEFNPLGARSWTSTTVDLTITFRDPRSIRKLFRKKHHSSP